MVNCNADVGCRYEFSNCLLEAYTNKVMLSIVAITIIIFMQRWDLSVTATQFSGRYQRKITFARERSWTASGNFLSFIRSYHIPSNISFISYRTLAPILIYQESYQADRGVHWSNILLITIFMILKMITMITAPVMMMMMMMIMMIMVIVNWQKRCWTWWLTQLGLASPRATPPTTLRWELENFHLKSQACSTWSKLGRVCFLVEFYWLSYHDNVEVKWPKYRWLSNVFLQNLGDSLNCQVPQYGNLSKGLAFKIQGLWELG